MLTRKQYLNKECTHREYYAQFVNEEMKRGLRREMLAAILDSKDEHMNDIPLRKWDSSGYYLANNFRIREMMKESQDFLTDAGIVCILKEAAKQIKEESISRRERLIDSSH